MKRFIPLLLAILIHLSSCSSFVILVRSQVEGLQSWVYNTTVRGDQMAFVGKGSSTVAYNARLASYDDILAQISTFVGEDIRDSYYRELTTTSRISDFNLSVTSEHQRTEKGMIKVYLLSLMDTTALKARQTTIYRQTQEREERISSLIKEADRAYRANDDTQAIARYLEAAAVASSDPSWTRSTRAPSWSTGRSPISRRCTSRSAPLMRAVTTVVQLRRRRRLISSRVVNASIRASFPPTTALANATTMS